jgi:hypothetical protein
VGARRFLRREIWPACLPWMRRRRSWFWASAREFDGAPLLGSFLNPLNGDEFEVAHCHWLALQQNVSEILIATTTVDQRTNVPVKRPLLYRSGPASDGSSGCRTYASVTYRPISLRSQRRSIGLFDTAHSLTQSRIRLCASVRMRGGASLDEGNMTLQRCLNVAGQTDFRRIALGRWSALCQPVHGAPGRVSAATDPGHGGTEDQNRIAIMYRPVRRLRPRMPRSHRSTSWMCAP